MSEIVWTNISVRLGDLKPWPSNPRCSTKKQAEKLIASWNEFGQVETIAVSPALDVYDGHQRLSALSIIYGQDYEIDARQSSRSLTEDERKKLVIYLHSGAVGSWDWDAISNWDAPSLIDWGMDADALKDWKRDVTALEMALISEGADVKDGFDFSSLPDEDRAPFRQVTFTLHDSQYEQMSEALKLSKSMGAFDSENENSNGNAIARICEVFITEHGNG